MEIGPSNSSAALEGYSFESSSTEVSQECVVEERSVCSQDLFDKVKAEEDLCIAQRQASSNLDIPHQKEALSIIAMEPSLEKDECLKDLFIKVLSSESYRTASLEVKNKMIDELIGYDKYFYDVTSGDSVYPLMITLLFDSKIKNTIRLLNEQKIDNIGLVIENFLEAIKRLSENQSSQQFLSSITLSRSIVDFINSEVIEDQEFDVEFKMGLAIFAIQLDKATKNLEMHLESLEESEPR